MMTLGKRILLWAGFSVLAAGNAEPVTANDPPLNARAATTVKRPHIVYVLADDMGHGDVRALRAECKFSTPHLDRLANGGVAFTQAYSGSSICTPTRYGVLTGRYCWRDGIGLASGYTGPEIGPDVPTVATFLRNHGYRTRMVGKWHLGGRWTGIDGSPVTERKARHGHDSSDGRRGWKATWFEGGHRVPFLARWPNGIQSEGRRAEGMITLEDFFATVADMLDEPLPEEAGDSASFLPQLKGRPQDKTQRTLIMSSLSNRLVLRHGQWKLICVGESELISRTESKPQSEPAIPDPDAPWHEQVVLYDLENDRAETTNRAQQNQAVVAEIAQLAIDAFSKGRTTVGPALSQGGSTPQIKLLMELTKLPKGNKQPMEKRNAHR